jgi:hypothetical protein
LHFVATKKGKKKFEEDEQMAINVNPSFRKDETEIGELT